MADDARQALLDRYRERERTRCTDMHPRLDGTNGARCLRQAGHEGRHEALLGAPW